MINYNGKVLDPNELNLSIRNRAFTYGDGIFDTLKYDGGQLYFIEDHYFRLMSSMRMLRMKIPMDFTLEYYQNQIQKLIDENTDNIALRIRVSVFRKEGGLYAPKTNEVSFLIEAIPFEKKKFKQYEIELFKDFQINSGLLSTIKSNNRLINVLASIYAQENAYENCLLINEKKNLVEAINSNVFLINGNKVRTPNVESGCINGIIRKKVIELLQLDEEFEIIETEISPFDLLKADEVFLTNSVTEFQSVHGYRKRNYQTHKTEQIKNKFQLKYMASH